MQGHPKCPSAVVSFSSCGCPSQPGAARSRRVPLRAGGRGPASPVGLGDVACSRWGLDLQPSCFQVLSLARSFWAPRRVTGCHLALPTAVFASLPEARGDDWVSSRGCSVLSSPRPPFLLLLPRGWLDPEPPAAPAWGGPGPPHTAGSRSVPGHLPASFLSSLNHSAGV